jgi:hypothetical protein
MRAPELKEEVLVGIVNQSGGPKVTSKGIIAHGAGISVPEEEAERLTHYFGVKRASDIVKDPSIAALKKENEALKAQMADLQKKAGIPVAPAVEAAKPEAAAPAVHAEAPAA